MNFKGVIFDLDGTLVNSLDDIADSMNSILRSFNYPVHELEAYKYFVGHGIDNLVRTVLPESHRDAPTVARCRGLMLDVYDKNCLNKTKPYDGIIDLLDELKSRKMKMGVLSNKPDSLTKKIVLALLPGFFEVIKGLESEEEKKPNPAGAQWISDKFGIQPEEMMYVGDSSIDMLTAKNAGMHGVGVLWGYGSGEELTASGAVCVLDYPMDLLAIL